jgi:multidrug resistance protein, MATE family
MEESARAPLLQPRGGDAAEEGTAGAKGRRACWALLLEWWVESKKLWQIVGPAILQRNALYGINAVSQAFIGHIGDLELAAFSIAAIVVSGFSFGFLVRLSSFLAASLHIHMEPFFSVL